MPRAKRKNLGNIVYHVLNRSRSTPPGRRGHSLCKNHAIRTLSESVQNYYNGPCASIDIADMKDFEEIIVLLDNTVQYNLHSEICA